MNRRWLLSNRDFLVRDLVRDYCIVHHLLVAQRSRFENDGTVSYTALRDLLGEAKRKGVFWRLKDTAHHLFRKLCQTEITMPICDLPADENTVVQETLIDWCVGYAFHECSKLKEDAFQRQHYANRLIQIARHDHLSDDTCSPLLGLSKETFESSSRELARIMQVLGHGLRLLALYLGTERHNTSLARWLACDEALAREAFGATYDTLMNSVFDGNRERLYLMAAKDFLKAGRREPALALLAGAQQKGQLGTEGLNFLNSLKLPAAAGRTCGICTFCDKKQCRPSRQKDWEQNTT
ncbi:MAG: hypothetical protein J5861_01300 [Desulfovibrio sp.]|nr:hypothetical protein [Desulfovibrio sp.]